MEPARIVPMPVDGMIQPQAPEIEQAVLGACLLENSAIDKVIDLLTHDHFYVDAHKHIFRAITEQRADGKVVDILTITVRLRENGLLDMVGGAFYIAQLTNSLASDAHVEHHAHIVAQKFIARKLIANAEGIKADAYRNEDVFDLLDRQGAETMELLSLANPREAITAASTITELTDSSPSRGISTGIYELDNYVKVHPGMMTVAAGRPGMGKSVVACFTEWHWSQDGYVMAFTPEMTPDQKTARYLSTITGVNYEDIIAKRCTPDELEAVSRAAVDNGARLSRILIDPTSGITPLAIKARIDRVRREKNVVGVTVDFLQRMTTGDRKTDGNDFARVTQCCRELTDIAKHCGLPFLVMSQLNREVEGRADKRPGLADLRSTGQIEQDAYHVLLLYRPGYYEPNPPETDELWISVAKNRNGRTGEVKTPIQPGKNRIGHTVIHNAQRITNPTPF